MAAVFLGLTVPRLLLHEVWRDEAWLWLVVTDLNSLADLLSPTSPLGRSGQGYLFPVLCWLAARLSTSPVTMQLLHGVLAAAAAFVVARWAPWDHRVRALVVLGYFPAFEYAVISRHYVVGMLLVWVAVASAGSRWSPLVGGAALGLLCQTTVYGYILAVALAAGWLWDRVLERRPALPVPRGVTAAGVALAVIGGVAGLVQLTPRPGTTYAAAWRVDWDPMHAEQVLATPWDGMVPLPRLELHFWNTNVLDRWPHVHAAAGLLAIGLAVALLRRHKAALVTFCVGGAGFLAFSYLKLLGSMRHRGHWWILLLAGLWMARMPGGRSSWRDRVLLVLLLVHCAAGAFATWMDLRHPFSNAAAIARTIRGEGLDRHTLVAGREPIAAPVALALDAPLYFPGRDAFGRYPDWSPAQRELGNEQLRCAARARAWREGRDVVLVVNRALPAWEEIEETGARLGAIEPSEDYRLYRMRVSRLALGAAANCE